MQPRHRKHAIQGALCLAVVLILVGVAAFGQEPEPRTPLPLVVEDVDEIAFVTVAPPVHEYEMTRVLFFRNGKLFATRFHVDDMTAHVHEDVISLAWTDYYSCERIVNTPLLSVWTLGYDPLEAVNRLEWFAQARVMTDLKQP